MNTIISKTQNLTLQRVIVFLTFAAGAFIPANIYAKTIRFKNESSQLKVLIYFPHFTSITGMDRYPIMDQFLIEPGGYEDVYIKPYQYAGDIYLPNIDWVDDAGGKGTEEGKKRVDQIVQDYSRGSSSDTNLEDRFSIGVLPVGFRTYNFVPCIDKQVGQLIQNMAESPKDNPSDGIAIKVETDGQEVKFEVSAAGSKKTYKGY